jgi:mRNA interferase RelE/StbE
MSEIGYKAALTKNFLKELKKLPEDVKARVLKAVDEVVANPYAGIKLKGELERFWRWRIGEYRIIYLFDERSKLVVFLDTGHRRAVYK